MENEKSLEKWLPDPDVGLRADFNYARFTGGLNLVEAAVFSAHFRRGIARDRLASATGLTPRQLATTLESIDSKLLKAGRNFATFNAAENSRSPAYLERLSSGRRAWAVARLDQTFIEVMQNERATLFAAFPTASERYPPVFGSIRPIDRGIMNLDALRTKFASEQAKLGRISEKTHQARVGLEEAEADVDRLQAAMKSEQAESILAEREWPSLDSKKKLAAAQTALGTAQAAYTASRSALDRQSEIVAQVQGEMETRHTEAFLAELQPIRKRLIERIYAAIPDAVEARDLAARYGMTSLDLSGGLFPQGTPGWQHFTDDIGPRNGLAATVNDLLNLHGMGERTGLARAV